jgi:hypothetical protein
MRSLSCVLSTRFHPGICEGGMADFGTDWLVLRRVLPCFGLAYEDTNI